METIRLKLPNVDRVGLVLDISEVLAARKINIISMEVEPNTAYLELEPMTTAVRRGSPEAWVPEWRSSIVRLNGYANWMTCSRVP